MVQQVQAGAKAKRVRFMFKDMEIDPTDPLSVGNRAVRKQLVKVGEKQAAKYAHLVHPDTGERPTLNLVIRELFPPSMEVRLVTDSPVVRDWLKGKGIVVGEALGDGPMASEAA